MRLFTTAVVVLLALAINVRAEDKKDKIDKSKLIGTWKLVKTDSPTPPPKGASLTVEFTKDGKVTFVATLGDKKRTGTASYKVDGDKLTTTRKIPNSDKEETETVTIKELTDKKFVTIEKKGDKTETTEFEKSK